jgi:hypothetical protein
MKRFRLSNHKLNLNRTVRYVNGLRVTKELSSQFVPEDSFRGFEHLVTFEGDEHLPDPLESVEKEPLELPVRKKKDIETMSAEELKVFLRKRGVPEELMPRSKSQLLSLARKEI